MRVLLVRAGALGDLLLLRRAIAALRRAGHETWLLAPEAGRVLLGPGPSEVEAHLPWDSAEVSALLAGGLAEEAPLARRLAETGAAIAFTRSPDVVAALRARVPRVRSLDPAPRLGHASDWLAAPTRELGADPEPMPPDLVPTADDERAARPWSDRLPPGFLALHPGSGSPAKTWPPERFRALAERLSPARPWLVVLGPAEDGAGPAFAGEGRVVLATGLPVRTLGALLARSGLVVGNDSGGSHLAAAFGAPTLALFGPSDPAVWSPVGGRVATVRSPTGVMVDLGLEPVIGAAGDLLGGGPAAVLARADC